MVEFETVLAVIPPVLVALNEGLKKAFFMPSRFAIIINWVIGIALSLALSSAEPVMAVVVGFLIGSSASGLYDIKKFF